MKAHLITIRSAIAESYPPGRTAARIEPLLPVAARLLAHASLAALAALTLALALPGPASGAGPVLKRALARIVAAPGGPPGALALIQRGRRVELHRAGVANVRTGRRPTAGDHMRIASMSKALNGAVALSLARAGRLDLDATVAEALPGMLPLAGDATLAQALAHTGGLPDYIRQQAFIDVLLADPRRYLPPADLLAFVADVPPPFPAGSEYEYSDTDNVVVGLAAERAAGRSYDRLLARRVYRPLRLRETSLPDTARMPRPVLRGYDVEPGEPPSDVTRFLNPALAWASGGIVSTPRDVNRFFRAYVRGSFSGAALRRRQRDFVRGGSSPPGPGRNASGLGLFRYRTRCGVVFGHTGSFPGYRMFAAASSSGRRSVVFAVNAQVVPGLGSRRVSRMIRRAQARAVCRALRA